MSDSSGELFRFEEKVLEKAQKIVENEKYQGNPLYKKYKSLMRMYKKLLFQSQKILKISDNNQEKLRKTQQNLALLLNNVKQGFLTFGEDFKISPEYSQECKNIFGQDIAGRDIYELLFKKSDSDAEKDILNSIFQDDQSRIKLYLPLLPQEIELNQKLLKIKYKYIEQEHKIMCIITDITEKRELENELEKERKNLKMTVTVISNQGIVKKYVNDYRHFFNHIIYEWFKEYGNQTILENLYRKIHTYKGVFSQWGMRNSSESLHKAEDKINDFQEENPSPETREIKKFISTIDFNGFIDQDIEIIEQILGENFLDREKSVSVKKDDIVELKERIKDYFPEGEREQMVTKIDKLIKKSLRDLIDIYEEYTFELAERVGKKLEQFKIESDGVLVDENKFHDLNKSLIHIFRNSIYHGIEKPEGRLKKGKPEGGSVKCKIGEEKGNIYITIRDDGQGINVDKIKKLAIDKNIYSENEIEDLSRNEILRLIFFDQFSTEEEVNQTAGRGVGLASVKREVEKLGGNISVETKLDQGTEITIIIPQEKRVAQKDEINMNMLMEKLEKKFVQYIGDNLELEPDQKNIQLNQIEQLELSDFNVITNIRFKNLYDIIFSVDKKAAQILVENFIDKHLDLNKMDQKKAIIRESLKEIMNIIIGQFFKSLEEEEGCFEKAPMAIAVEGGLLDYKNNEIIKHKFSINQGLVNLNLIARN